MITSLDAIFNRELFSSLNTICALERISAQLLHPIKRWQGHFNELKPAGPSLHSNFGTISVQVLQLQLKVCPHLEKQQGLRKCHWNGSSMCVGLLYDELPEKGRSLTLLTPGALSLKGARTGLPSLVHVPHITPQSAVGSTAQGSLGYPTSTEMM